MESVLTTFGVKDEATKYRDLVQAWWANGGKERSVWVAKKAAWYSFVCLMVMVAALYLASNWLLSKAVENAPQIRSIVIGGLTQYLPQQAQALWTTGKSWAWMVITTGKKFAHQTNSFWSESVDFVLCRDDNEAK